MKRILPKVLGFLVILAFSLFCIPVAHAQTTYVNPDDTSVNMDFMLIVGGALWFGGVLFYSAGRYVTKKYEKT